MGRFGRRRLLSALGLLGALLPALGKSEAQEAESSFAEWVNTLYVGALALREAAEVSGGGAAFTDLELQSLFSPEVQAMHDAVADRALPPREPDGPILDLLFGWGALPKLR